ncbi:metallo-beta-lactamase [Mortierella sp. GBAus27b]|nr:metallo-beta-lactamase [Mortierella sp. GBAus27b]
MTHSSSFVCVTCGTNAPASASSEPLDTCIICDEPRQYVRLGGQEWTTLDKIREEGKHSNEFKPTEADPENMISISTTPQFAIGQRGILIRTPKGNILWDCITYIDKATVDRVKELGGLKAIVISHPHYYSSLKEWSEAFGGIPVYTHVNDKQWVQRTADNHVFWEGTTLDLLDGEIKVLCPGGHFDGSALLLWNKNLLVADTMMVASSRKSVSFMYSFPNYWPLAPNAVKAIWRTVRPYQIDNILGAWVGKEIVGNGRNVIFESAKLYTEYSGHEAAKFYGKDSEELAFN